VEKKGVEGRGGVFNHYRQRDILNNWEGKGAGGETLKSDELNYSREE